jgi:hypothetical protein
MAINPGAQWPTKTTAPDANYPYGSSKNETTPGSSNDGTPHVKIRGDDIFGFQQAILQAAGIVPSGSADTAVNSQYLTALLQMMSGQAIEHTDTGAANAYVLNPTFTNMPTPAAYFDGFTVRFKPANSSSLATATVNISGLGVKNIVNSTSTVISTFFEYELVYQAGSDDFRIGFYNIGQAEGIRPGVLAKANGNDVSTATSDTEAITPLGLADGFDLLSNLGSNGYQQLTNGWMIQWGINSVSNTTQTKSFPIAFPNQSFSVMLTQQQPGAAAQTDANLQIVGTPTTTTYNVFQAGGGPWEFFFIAVGY